MIGSCNTVLFHRLGIFGFPPANNSLSSSSSLAFEKINGHITPTVTSRMISPKNHFNSCSEISPISAKSRKKKAQCSTIIVCITFRQYCNFGRDVEIRICVKMLLEIA